MQEVLNYIEIKKKEYTKLPLFSFLDNSDISPKTRLSFAPCIAHFIMSFSDFNKYVLREKNPETSLQKIINEHTYEDDHHWPWFVTDLEKLGFNFDCTFTQALRFLWSEQTKVSRRLSYELSAHTLEASPVIKIVIIEAIEATGNVLFSRTAKVASLLQQSTQQEYIYFGNFHFNLETGHAMADNSESDISKIEMTDEEKQEAFATVDKIFNIFSEWTYELLDYANKETVVDRLCEQKDDCLTV